MYLLGVLIGALDCLYIPGDWPEQRTYVKVPMKGEIICAYLKGLSKNRRMAFFVLKYLFSFWRYGHFSIMQIRSVMTSHCLQLKSGKYLINDISGSIQAVFLKLGIINVHHERNKTTPLVLLLWQLFRLQSLSAKKLNIPICKF